LLALACCIQLIYIPTSNRLTGGVEPKLPIDVFPVWPIWVVPYVLCYLLWLGSIAWVIFKMEDRSFRSFVAACFLTFSLGAATFVFFPTYVTAAALPGGDIFTVLLRTIHENWGRYAALPSGHVYITTLIALFFGRWYPHQRLLWILAVVVVSLSTLFTGQHYVLDVLGGFLVAAAGYRFGLRWVGIRGSEKDRWKGSRKSIASPPH
jgi:membrane-associated phospholipid phosphatase